MKGKLIQYKIENLEYILSKVGQINNIFFGSDHEELPGLINKGYVSYIQACDDNCPNCNEWNKDGQRWKFNVFTPVHCAFCYCIKNESDYTIVTGLKDRYLSCEECKQKIINIFSDIHNIRFRETFGRFKNVERLGMFYENKEVDR